MATVNIGGRGNPPGVTRDGVPVEPVSTEIDENGVKIENHGVLSIEPGDTLHIGGRRRRS